MGARGTTPYQDTTWTAALQQLTWDQTQQHRNRSPLGTRRNDSISGAHLGTDATTPCGRQPIKSSLETKLNNTVTGAHSGPEGTTPYRERTWEQMQQHYIQERTRCQKQRHHNGSSPGARRNGFKSPLETRSNNTVSRAHLGPEARIPYQESTCD